MLKLYQIGQTKSQSVIALSHISANVLFPTAIHFFPIRAVKVGSY
jgi:hypothetical protein